MSFGDSMRQAQAWGLSHQVKVRGRAGSILWGYHTAATIGAWRIRRKPQKKGEAPQWTLSADVGRLDKFQTRQQPLVFTAPRQRGWWCWPVIGDLQHVGPNQIRAILGPPEQ